MADTDADTQDNHPGSEPMAHPRHEQFCLEYIIDFNAAASARRSGYATSSSTAEGSRLLANRNIKTRIQFLIAERVERTKINADAVVMALSRHAFTTIKEFYGDDGQLKALADMDPEAAAAIRSIKTVRKADWDDVDSDGKPSIKNVDELRMSDPLKAMELLGRHLGMFTDKVEHSGELVQNVMQTPMPVDGEDAFEAAVPNDGQ